MPDLLTRTQHEDEAALLILLYLLQLDQAIGGGGQVDWLNWTAQLSRELTPVLAATYMEAAEQLAGGHDGYLTDAETRARDWAARRANWLASALATTTQNAMYQAAEGLGVTVNAIPPESLAEFLEALEHALSEARAEAAGITETTEAITQGEVFAAAELERFGLKLIAFWQTERDGKVCPVCRGLDGRPRDEWWSEHGNGPPAHPACRCTLDWRQES